MQELTLCLSSHHSCRGHRRSRSRSANCRQEGRVRARARARATCVDAIWSLAILQLTLPSSPTAEEEVVEAPSPEVKKAVPARKGRAAKATPVAVLEDEDVETPAPTRAARGKRTVLREPSSSEEAPATVVKSSRSSRAKAVVEEEETESENAAPVATTTRAKRAPAVKKVADEAAPSTGRALRARR